MTIRKRLIARIDLRYCNTLFWKISSVIFMAVIVVCAAAAKQVSAPQTTPLLESEGVRLPFQYDPPLKPFIVVQVSIDGQPPLPFIVDTGFSFPLMVDAWAIKKLKLQPANKEGILNGNVKLTGFAVHSLDIEADPAPTKMHYTLTGSAATAFALNLEAIRKAYSGDRIAGIIGAPILAPTTIRFDFAEHLLTIVERPHLPLNIKGATNVPLTEKQGCYFVSVTTMQGDTASLEVDTGGLMTCLPLTVGTKLKPVATKMDGGERFGSFSLTDRWLLPNLHVGDLVEPNMAANAEDADIICPLGMDFLTRYRVTLDFRNGFMTLERARDYEQRARLHGWTGAYLEQKGKTLRVEKVTPGSPADKAGLNKGDQILRIDDSVSDMNTYLAQRLLDGYMGVPVVLVIKHMGREQTITLLRGSEFDMPATPITGISIRKQNDQFFRVLSVAPTSLAAKAGLKVGDQIIAMNNTPAVFITSAGTWELTNRNKITLSIVREGEGSRDIVLALPETTKP